MKIRKLKLGNHPFFGDFEIDFTKDGKTVDTIIIAGENGCGKSLLLNEIFSLVTVDRIESGTKKEIKLIEVELTKFDIERISSPDLKEFFDFNIQEIKNNILYFKFNFELTSWDQIDIYFFNSLNYRQKIKTSIIQNDSFKSMCKSIFSDVEINYIPQQIKSVTAKEIDTHKGSSMRSSQNLATEIAQLFVDMVNSDAIDYSAWSERYQVFNKAKLHTRLDRFTNAFNQMFPNKRYKKVGNVDGGKSVIFAEHDKESSLSQLSSGEKQIVFRGGFLLKDVNSLKGALVLIDEPEISLHPAWQMKIMDFYKNIFTDGATGIQTSQIITTTHSPFIIHNPNRSNDKVIILKKDSSGRIYVSDRPAYYSWTNEELVKEAFNVDLSSTNAQNIVFVEGETDEKYFKKCLELKCINNIEIKWIGSYIDGGAKNTGDKALNSAYSFLKSNCLISQNKKIVFLYDTDTNMPDSADGNLFIRCMRYNQHNTKYKKGVENLLVLPQKFEYDRYYSSENIPAKDDGYGGGTPVIPKISLLKTKLCDDLCDDKAPEDQQSIFVNIFAEIDKLKTIFGV